MTAAATAIGSTRTLAAPEPIAFAADRPFYFTIADRETGAVLFMGQIADPQPE
jgi:serpin B